MRVNRGAMFPKGQECLKRSCNERNLRQRHWGIRRNGVKQAIYNFLSSPRLGEGGLNTGQVRYQQVEGKNKKGEGNPRDISSKA